MAFFTAAGNPSTMQGWSKLLPFVATTLSGCALAGQFLVLIPGCASTKQELCELRAELRRTQRLLLEARQPAAAAAARGHPSFAIAEAA